MLTLSARWTISPRSMPSRCPESPPRKPTTSPRSGEPSSPHRPSSCSPPPTAIRSDCSPKGDVPGFVQLLDDRTLLIPDRPGNNRIDGMKNLLVNPKVGIIFMVPGSNETYRVTGSASISTDPALLKRFEMQGKLPRV